MFARFDENPAMTLQDIKETKRYGRTHARTDGRTHGQRENSLPTTNKVCAGYKYAINFASTQLRITRLRKYPIDPKAYLGRCQFPRKYGTGPSDTYLQSDTLPTELHGQALKGSRYNRGYRYDITLLLPCSRNPLSQRRGVFAC